ncbi:excinuclease ABC subunit UvrC [Candidatus Micrarchaeota archaeon]|nr:excinuclease ABC subunit UvrC [Candidatus Micrarchaeota archaeon]
MNKPLNLPHSPGVYQFSKDGKVLYVGKAKNLASRVGSYFGQDAPEKARRLVQEAERLETTLTHSETEALLLEQALIQQHLPEYNVMLKDGVRYAYLLMQKKPFRFKTIRRQAGQAVPKGKLYGPFAKGSHRWELIRLLRSLFFEKTGKPFGSTENEDAYQLIESVLDGKSDIRTELQTRMVLASKSQDYEKALRYKKRLAALDAMDEHQAIEQKTSAHQDIIGFAHDGDHLAAQVFHVRWGVLREQEKYTYETLSEDTETEFITCYYATHEPPKDIILRMERGTKNANNEEPEIIAAKRLEKNENTPAPKEKNRTDKNDFETALKTLFPQAVIKSPKSGTAAELLDLAEKNAQRLLSSGIPDDVIALQKALGLRKLPRRIEGFDISTLQGNQTVGAMVSFHDGKPDKDNYRYFNINTPAALNASGSKTGPKPDDFAAMEEIVYRRYDRLTQEKQKMPDLVLIDGGKGQLTAALNAFERAGIRIHILALAKEYEEIYLPERSQPIRLQKNHAGLKMLQRVRDEVHRFVIGFHRRKRDKMPE